ncbi:hypothetical protein HNP84_001970 [Thermocatellispora tengchongensis]|uniref:ChsH2 C-terminal OB-fold domain-containing protein n=1 Tax=Thermocatellispora tengchongensis TaxID=1073253 RepID=A0A840NU43_9ACTN|nr:OB-fold domain-containing protein [Thermocatellispora tengchongensis]MBB5132254.1 hypothetical protein [Thermocatellispora tengchongensis]
MTLTPVERDERSAPFFDAAARGVLLLRYSPSSGMWSEPDALVCGHTGAADLEWRESGGRGHLVSWTVLPGRDAPGTVIGLVELAEGPWLTVRLTDAEGPEVAAGMPVRIGFARPEGGEAMPVGLLHA